MLGLVSQEEGNSEKKHIEIARDSSEASIE